MKYTFNSPGRSSDGFSEGVHCSSGYGCKLPDYCASLNVDLAAELIKVGLEPDAFTTEHHSISFDRFARLLENLADIAGDEAFGLHYAETFTPGDTGPVGLAMAHAPTLGDAWRFYVEFSDLLFEHAYYQMDIVEDQVVFSWGYSPFIPRHFQFGDLGMMLGWRNIRLFVGQDACATKYLLRRSAPKDSSEHSRLLCRHITFDHPTNTCFFPASWLERSRPGADTRIYSHIRMQCVEMMEKRRAENNVFYQVEQRIAARIQGNTATLQRIADDLGVNDRTLQRRLAQKETSFDDMLDATRKRIADTLLQRQDISLAEIAGRCGYSSPAAFSRAVRGWHGKSPSEIRESVGRTTG
jgi:AraC-like DNA-binding protein